MATTKRAQYRFVVKEGPSFMREIREGVLEPVSDAFITAEPCGREPVGERPLKDTDFLSFDLGPGLSVDHAQQVADFLNEHVQYVAITQFGDAEDAARDVRLSERTQGINLERFSMVVGDLKEKLAVGDVPAAIEEMASVQSVIGDLIADWSKALAMAQEILGKFGEGRDRDAT